MVSEILNCNINMLSKSGHSKESEMYYLYNSYQLLRIVIFHKFQFNESVTKLKAFGVVWIILNTLTGASNEYKYKHGHVKISKHKRDDTITTINRLLSTGKPNNTSQINKNNIVFRAKNKMSQRIKYVVTLSIIAFFALLQKKS